MNNNIFKRLLNIISKEREDFNTLIDADNILGLNVTSDEIINFLEFFSSEKALKAPIIGNIIITEGDILSVLKVLNDLSFYEGEYIIYINDDNLGTNTYLVESINKIYEELNLNVKAKLDYSRNYNAYLKSLVTIVGSNEFVTAASKDFENYNQAFV